VSIQWVTVYSSAAKVVVHDGFASCIEPLSRGNRKLHRIGKKKWLVASGLLRRKRQRRVKQMSLANRTVALAEGRQLEELVQMLEKEGATALRCPMLSILDAPDETPVLA